MSERQIRDTPSAVTPALPGRLRHHRARGLISPMNDARPDHVPPSDDDQLSNPTAARFPYRRATAMM